MSQLKKSQAEEEQLTSALQSRARASFSQICFIFKVFFARKSGKKKFPAFHPPQDRKTHTLGRGWISSGVSFLSLQEVQRSCNTSYSSGSKSQES